MACTLIVLIIVKVNISFNGKIRSWKMIILVWKSHGRLMENESSIWVGTMPEGSWATNQPGTAAYIRYGRFRKLLLHYFFCHLSWQLYVYICTCSCYFMFGVQHCSNGMFQIHCYFWLFSLYFCCGFILAYNSQSFVLIFYTFICRIMTDVLGVWKAVCIECCNSHIY